MEVELGILCFSQGNMFDKIKILEEDKTIAAVALNAPEYSLETCKSLFPET